MVVNEGNFMLVNEYNISEYIEEYLTSCSPKMVFPTNFKLAWIYSCIEKLRKFILAWSFEQFEEHFFC